MAFILRKLVHNEAMRTDPPEIYGWRVWALACSVSSLPFIQDIQLTDAGMLRRHVVRHGNRHYWRCPHHEAIHGVCFSSSSLTYTYF